MTIDGRMEAVRDGRVSGWAWEVGNDERRVEVRVIVDGEPVAETTASVYRPRLCAAGIGDGAHGYDVALPASLADGGRHAVQVVAGRAGTLLRADHDFACAVEPSSPFAGTGFIPDRPTPRAAAPVSAAERHVSTQPESRGELVPVTQGARPVRTLAAPLRARVGRVRRSATAPWTATAPGWLRGQVISPERVRARLTEGVRDRRLAVPLGGRWIPAGILVVVGAFLLWTRVIPLTNSLWADEIHTVWAYIGRGPSGIWGDYTPNDHMLFELLAWATLKLMRYSSEEVFRIWSVVPALGAVFLLIAWSWRRLGSWPAAVFGVLAATSPLCMLLSLQARGYGLGFLASAVVVIGADGLLRESSPRALWCFAGGGLLGILTLPTFALPFLTVSASLLIARSALRRAVLRAVGIVGLVAALFYAPVLGAALSNAASLTDTPLPWHGFVTGPLIDLAAPTVHMLIAPVSLGLAETIAAAVLVGGVVALVRTREGPLAAILLLPAPISYLAFEITRRFTTDRYMSFLLLPLLLLGAIALVAGARAIAASATSRPAFTVAIVAAGVLFCLFVLRRGENQYLAVDAVPIENWREVARIVRPESAVFTNSRFWDGTAIYLEPTLFREPPVRESPVYHFGEIYLPGTPVTVMLNPTLLENTICGDQQAFAYVEHSLSPSPQVPTACLVSRHALEYKVDQTRGAVNVWLVPPAPTSTVSPAKHPSSQ